MSALPPLPLRTYRPDWEERWEAVHARHLGIKTVALAPHSTWQPTRTQTGLIEDLRETGEEMCRLFEAQFRTTDDYAGWRLKWLSNALSWEPALSFEMPSGLPIVEIRRRLEAARDSWLGSDLKTSGEHDFRRQVHVHAILSEPASVAVASLAYALARIGGDHV